MMEGRSPDFIAILKYHTTEEGGDYNAIADDICRQASGRNELKGSSKSM
jgi:hypothetical protein